MNPDDNELGVDLNRACMEISWTRSDPGARGSSRHSVDKRAGAAVCLTGLLTVHTPTEAQLKGRNRAGDLGTPKQIVKAAADSGDLLKVGDPVFLGLK